MGKKKQRIILKVQYLKIDDVRRFDLERGESVYGNLLIQGSINSESFGITNHCGNSLGAIDCNGELIDDWANGNPRKVLKETKSKVWDLVIKFKGFQKGPILNLYRARWLINECLNVFLKANDMDLDNVYWFISLHANSVGQHLHVLFWEKNQTRWKCNHSGRHWHKGKLKDETLRNLKENIMYLVTSLKQ